MGSWGFVGIHWVCSEPSPSHWTVVYSLGHKTKPRFPSFYKVLLRWKMENRLSNYFFWEKVPPLLPIPCVTSQFQSSSALPEVRQVLLSLIFQLGKLRFRDVAMMWIVQGHTASVVQLEKGPKSLALYFILFLLHQSEHSVIMLKAIRVFKEMDWGKGSEASWVDFS